MNSEKEQVPKSRLEMGLEAWDKGIVLLSEEYEPASYGDDIPGILDSYFPPPNQLREELREVMSRGYGYGNWEPGDGCA